MKLVLSSENKIVVHKVRSNGHVFPDLFKGGLYIIEVKWIFVLGLSKPTYSYIIFESKHFEKIIQIIVVTLKESVI